MGFAIGGITQPMCELLDEGLVKCVVDAQAFDQASIESIKNNPRHFEISTSEYANPMNKGAYVNKLDFVILGALEVDVDFNCNVVVGIRRHCERCSGRPSGHCGRSKCSIIVAPLVRGRIPTICTRCTSVTTAGEAIDIVVTDYGIAINPRRKDLVEAYRGSKLPIRTIEELRDAAYAITGVPDPIEFEDRIVGIIESRDGTIMDVVRKIKE